jgi:hypothetical protein
MVSVRLLVFTLILGLCAGTLQAIAWEPAGIAGGLFSSQP